MSDSAAVEKGDGQVRDLLPVHNEETKTAPNNGNLAIRPEGESGRRGIHPFKVMAICFRSSCTLSKYVNFLWPVVPVALALVSPSFLAKAALILTIISIGQSLMHSYGISFSLISL
jgi:hypothetical protein